MCGFSWEGWVGRHFCGTCRRCEMYGAARSITLAEMSGRRSVPSCPRILAAGLSLKPVGRRGALIAVFVGGGWRSVSMGGRSVFCTSWRLGFLRPVRRKGHRSDCQVASEGRRGDRVGWLCYCIRGCMGVAGSLMAWGCGSWSAMVSSVRVGITCMMVWSCVAATSEVRGDADPSKHAMRSA